MAKASKRKTETSRRTRQREAAATTVSSSDVASIIRAADLTAKDSKAIERFLSDLQAGYRRQLDLLEWHASDKQIEKHLTRVAARADALSKALKGKAIEDKLLSAFVRTSEFPSTDQPEFETHLKGFEDDIAAVRRIHDVARKAIQLHDREVKAYPDQGKLASAAKPELHYVAKCIVEFWKKGLRRGISGRAGTDLHRFAVGVFDQITGELRDENAIRIHIRNVVESDAAKAGRGKSQGKKN